MSIGDRRHHEIHHPAQKRRLSEQGQITDGVTVFADGDPGLRCLLMSALPTATHILDWFHLTCDRSEIKLPGPFLDNSLGIGV